MEHWKNKSIKSLKGEVWKPISGFANRYMVSNLGRVKSLSFEKRIGKTVYKKPEKIMAINVCSNYYLFASLSINGVTKKMLVHRLVLSSFIPNEHGKKYVCHIDDNPQNNKLENLFWGTPYENTQDMLKKARMRLGENRPQSKLKNEVVLEIKKKLLYSSLTEQEVADMYKTNRGTVSDIRTGKKWRSVLIPGETLENSLRPGYAKRYKNKHHKHA